MDRISQKQFRIGTVRRWVDQIETMVADLERGMTSLEVEIRAEENRTGIHVPAHCTYSSYAKAALARRDNLKSSTDGLKVMLNDAKVALAEALQGVEEAGDIRPAQVYQPQSAVVRRVELCAADVQAYSVRAPGCS